jgi:hypothetical protein
VHHKNVVGAISRWMIIDDKDHALWSLSVKRKWIDSLSDVIKKVIIDWWTYETRVNPNKKDVTHKKIAASVFDEHPTHHLMETQVHNYVILNLIQFFHVLDCE